MSALDPTRDSQYRHRHDLNKDPHVITLKRQLAEARAEVRHLRFIAKRHRERAELWRQRCLQKGRR